MSRVVWVSSNDMAAEPLDDAIRAALTPSELEAFRQVGEIPEDIEVRVSLARFAGEGQGRG